MRYVGVRNMRRRMHGKAWCCLARVFAMAFGLCLALGVMLAYLDALLPHDYEVEMQDPLAGLIWLVPLLLAAVAWSWHLVGGVSIVLAAAVFFSYFLLKPPYEAATFYFVCLPPALLFLAGGVLHLIAWVTERSRS
jgi:hypothetical protein